MKQLFIIALVTLFSLPCLSQPKYLKDAVVHVTLKNGTTYTFSSNEYKVVPRVENKQCKQDTREFKHSVAFLGGRSKSKFDVNHHNNTVHSTLDYEFVYGLEYRLTHMTGYFGEFGFLSNDTVFFGIGKEF